MENQDINGRPFHDHGSFNGQCSKEKHAVVANGRKIDGEMEPVQASMKRMFEFTRQLPDGIYCACCRRQLSVF